MNAPGSAPPPDPASPPGDVVTRRAGLSALRAILVRLRFVGLVAAVALLAAVADDLSALGRGLSRRLGPRGPLPAGTARATTVEGSEYACPMHPDAIRGQPGTCPACGMPLAPRPRPLAASSAAGPRLALSVKSGEQGGITLVAVERRPLWREIRAPFTLEIDERRLARVSTRFKALVSALRVSGPGDPVRRGQPLALLEVPELLSYTRDLVRARAAGEADAQRTVNRERLLLLGLTTRQLDRLTESGDPLHLEVHAPMDGTVVSKLVAPGDVVMEGQPLLAVADLGRLWAVARLYQDDAALVEVGAPLVLEAPGLPGGRLEAEVTWRDAALDPGSRTLAVRTEVENRGGALRPGMSGRATVRLPLGAAGAPPLSLPASAVVDTGAHRVVWREVAAGSYEPVEVQLGPRAGERYLVTAGLAEGDRVVEGGAFLLWAEARLKAGAFARPTPAPAAATDCAR